MFFFPSLDVLRGITRVLARPQSLGLDPGSSIKLLLSKIGKMFLASMVRFYPGRVCHHHRHVKTYELRKLRRLYRTNICKILMQNLTIVGIIRKNRKTVPRKFLPTKGKKKATTHIGFHKKAVIASHCPKKEKALLL